MPSSLAPLGPSRPLRASGPSAAPPQSAGPAEGSGLGQAGDDRAGTTPTAQRARPLLTLSAVQRHAAPLLARIQAGESAHFTWDAQAHEALLARLGPAVREAAGAPGRPSPWPRYAHGDVDRWGELAWAEGLAPGALADHHREERARTRIDLLLVTALIACEGAPGWRYRDLASGQEVAGADALAVAALRFFASGACSSQPHRPLRADARALAGLAPQQLAAAFPAVDGQPLPGLARRAARLRRLGEVALAHAALFCPEPDVPGQDPPRQALGPVRLGHLLDACLQRARDGVLAADDLLALLLAPLNDLAPGRLSISGQPLGDCWAHPHAPEGLVPLHGLAHWLALGLVEPLRDAGLTVQGLGVAAAGAGWRLGGWLLDTGVLRPRQPGLLARPARLDEPAVVEWRAATCAAFDPIGQALLGQHDTPARAAAPGALHTLLCRLAREDAARLRPGGRPAWLPPGGELLG